MSGSAVPHGAVSGDGHSPTGEERLVDDLEVVEAYGLEDGVAGLMARLAAQVEVFEDPRVAYTAALAGAVVVPDYRVTVGQRGEFVAVPEDPGRVTVVEAALIAGDCRRRFEVGRAAGDGVDPFADVRHGRWVGVWPADGWRQRLTFPCPRCGLISVGVDDVADGYCGACHDRTGSGGEQAGRGCGCRLAVEEGSSAAGWWERLTGDAS